MSLIPVGDIFIKLGKLKRVAGVADTADDVLQGAVNLTKKAENAAELAVKKGCFIAGTLVSSESGLVPIETIKAGDKVFAWNEQTGEIALKEFVKTFVHEVDTLVIVQTESSEIVTTTEHPFWVEEKGWVPAGRLTIGDKVCTENGAAVYVKNITVQHLEELVKVYNFEVEGFHTYYVTEEEILVHNTCNANIEKIGKINGKTPRNNQVQNKQVDFLSKKYKLTRDERQLLHDEITHKGFDYKEVERTVQEIVKERK